MARTGDDYNLPDLEDSVLQELASNPKKYGEKSKLAIKELQSRKGLTTSSQQYSQGAQANLAALYAPAYRAISEQVAPQFTAARNYLATNPAAANSGVPNRLNRQILTGAFGNLANSFGQASANAAQGGNDLLSSLIQRRVQSRYDREAAAAAKKKSGGIGGTLGSIAGAVGGSVLGPMGSAVGTKLGNSIIS